MFPKLTASSDTIAISPVSVDRSFGSRASTQSIRDSNRVRSLVLRGAFDEQ